MLIYDIVSLVCMAILAAIVLTVGVKIAVLRRPDKINYIRNFKKGKCAIVYVVAIPLFFLNNIYVGKTVFEAVLDAASKAIYLIALKYDTSSVKELAAVSPIFKATVYFCLVVVIANALMLSVSLFHQSVWEALRRRAFRSGKCDRCLIVGNTKEGRMLYASCHARRMLVDRLTPEAEGKLFVDNVTYRSFVKGETVDAWLGGEVDRLVRALRGTHCKVNLIVAKEDEKETLAIAGHVVRYIESRGREIVDNFAVYIFGNREYEDIYSKFEARSLGCLHYVNEYREIAIDFIDKYPLTEYMTEAHLDTETSLVRPETDVTVAMIGFGRTNQQVFLSMVANNRLMTADGEGNPVPKRVTYHLFDKLHTEGHKNLNHNYFRYKYAFLDAEGNPTVDTDAYLPLPETPAEEEYHYFDINDRSFYEDLYAVIGKRETDLTYIIVSIGNDYASIDITNKIAAKLKEWKVTGCHVFVRVKDRAILKDSAIFLDRSLCRPFGTEAEVAYDYAHVIREKFGEMAILENYVYNVEHDMCRGPVTEAEVEASRLRWYTERTALERESNLYACLSLRNKLHMMGLDYKRKTVADLLREAEARLAAHPADAAPADLLREVEALKKRLAALPEGEREDGLPPLSEAEYLAIYAKGDPLDIVEEDGRRRVRYPLDPKPSRRTTMAMQEHSRWCAYMIMQGFVPSTLERILGEKHGDRFTNGKSYEQRYHGNLTTFAGLYDFRQRVAAARGIPEAAADVIKYDYQLLDGAHRLLDESGCKIYRR